MAHKILIAFTIDVLSQFKGLLKAGEAVRGEVAALSFSVKNVGAEVFPGGLMRSLRIEYGQPAVAQSAWTSEWVCPPLTPNLQQEVFKVGFAPAIEGLAWIHLSVVPRDGGVVEYYQEPTEAIKDRPDWVGCFYVVNREMLQIITHLARMKGG